MADGTKIEWTHRPGTISATMNALVGCQKVSAGCANCYAIDVAHVRAGNPLQVMQDKFAGTTKREGGKTIWTGKVTLTEKALLAPLTAKKPHTYFVNSMSDLFMDGVPDEWIDKHFAVFALCPQHTFIVLTKRPERMNSYLAAGMQYPILDAGSLAINGGDPGARVRIAWKLQKMLPVSEWERGNVPWPLPNVWLGVSVENQKTADERIPLLLDTPAAVRFLSCEPLLGPVDLNEIEGVDRLDWIISGGESGSRARPMHPAWPRLLRDWCAEFGVPFFFKQWGEWLPRSACYHIDAEGKSLSDLDPTAKKWPCTRLTYQGNNGRDIEHSGEGDEAYMQRAGKKAAGHLLDGVEHHAFPGVR